MPERGLNKVELIGRVGNDPDVRSIQSGKVVAMMNLATNDIWKKDGETHQRTEWHRLEMWEGLAETAGKYVKKGSRLYVEGSLRTDEYQDSEGLTRRTTKIRVRNMIMLDNRRDGNSHGDGSKQSDPYPNVGGSYDGDDIPF